MKRLFTLLAAISLVLLSVSTTFADDGDPPPVPATITIQSVVTNQSEITKQIFSDRGRPGGVNTNASTSRTVGSWTIRYSNAAAYGTGGGNKYVQHYYARTEKVAGTGSYQAETHATLIKGNNYGGQQVFNYFTHPCARAVVNNATAQSCASPWQRSSTGQQWFIISGHYFDIGIDGTRDSECPGCIDWVYTTP